MMKRPPLLLLTGLTIATLSSCTKSPSAPENLSMPNNPTADEVPVTPTSPVKASAEMTQGSAINPSSTLIDWLDNNTTRDGSPVLVRLPVVVRFRSDKLGIAGAHIGTALGAAPTDAVELRLTDTALSIGLWERLQKHCNLGADFCVLWLEGYWRDLMPTPGLPGLEDPSLSHPFDVRDVVGPVDPKTTSVFIAK
jgi:hypothetical protein